MNYHSLYLRKKFWIKDYFNGSKIGKPYKELKQFFKFNFEDAEAYRQEALLRLLEHAEVNTQFYSSYKSKKLTDFPVMNKSSLLENYDSICVDIQNIPNQDGPLHIQSTSGSTGTPFKVPQDSAKRYRRIAELKYFGKIVGFNTHEKLIHLRTWNRWQSKTPKQIKEENIIPFDISKMGDSELHDLCEIINKSNAICLRGYASSFDLLANYMEDKNISCPSVKIIIAGSEALHEDVREKVKRVIKCEIISQYADEECGILAQERIPTQSSDNIMYLNNASYIFECLKLEEDKPAEYGELGRLVVTDLHNYAFPIIRYDTGDVAVFLPPDEHSGGFPVMSKLYGRRFDVCYTTASQPFSPMSIGRVLKHYDKILQWQFIQKGRIEYLLKVNMKHGVDMAYLDEAIQSFKDILGNNAQIGIEIVDEIPTLASGKRKPVINEWKKV